VSRVQYPAAPAVKREAEEDWGRAGPRSLRRSKGLPVSSYGVRRKSRIHHMIACHYRGSAGCDQCHRLVSSFFGRALKFKDPIAAGGEAGGGKGLGSLENRGRAGPRS
jgi:hypothetical protein